MGYVVEIECVTKGWWRTRMLDFRDDGPFKPGAKTRQFSVFSRINRSLLGHIKWWVNWRQYCFFPLNSLFDKNTLKEVAQFCQEATDVHKSRLPNLGKRKKEIELAKRQRTIERLAKRRKEKSMEKPLRNYLTKRKRPDTMVLVNEVPAPKDAQKPVVEDVRQELKKAETPLGECLGEIYVA